MNRLKLLYVANGMFATLVHYAVLRALVDGFRGLDVGICNFGASFVGLTVSFLGNRLLVFKGTVRSPGSQFLAYALLYCILAIIQGVLMHVFVEFIQLHLTAAFLLCVAFQLVAGFSANKYIIFSR